MKKLQIIKNALERENVRSAWSKGVKEYALEVLELLEFRASEEGREPEDLNELKSWALNGAKDWKVYSYGGMSLIFDFEIAERLCSPSELKRVKDGDRMPNRFENWLDVQARALRQAFIMIERNV